MDLFLNYAIAIYQTMRGDVLNFAKEIFLASDLNKNETLEPDEYFYLTRTLDPN
jgi:hypothetical protein